MGRLGKPEDIAKAILFLASEDASWITGTFFHVDGGYPESVMLYLRGRRFSTSRSLASRLPEAVSVPCVIP